MFSKALYKQSCKANMTMWTIITFAVCFMLACVMLISGGGSIGKAKTSIQDAIIVGAIDSNINEMSINYYNIDRTACDEFDQKFYTTEYQTLYTNTLTATGESAKAYMACLGQFNTEYIVVKYGANDTETGKTAYGIIMSTLSNENYHIENAGASDRASHLDNLSRVVVTNLISTSFTSEESIDKMVEALEKYQVDKEKFESFGYTMEKVDDMTNTTILSYQAREEYELSKLNAKLSAGELTTEQYNQEKQKMYENLKADLSNSLLSSLPEEVSSSLEEVGQMDLYSLVVGSIYYKMAGLLLPIIFMIMASTSLIAGQVDSGSMAYVLSTSTKRKQVTFTQAIYLVSSLAVMFVCTTITSLICLAVVKSETITITYGQILLLNLGAFITMFAMSGICFLASCWFDRSKKAMGIGGGLCMFFLVATMLGLFGSHVLPSLIRLNALNYFNYVSIISLFDVVSIIENGTAFIWKFAILVAIGLAGYIIGSLKFEKKDLPL